MRTETKVEIPLATVPAATALAIARWKKTPSKTPSAIGVVETAGIAPAAGNEGSSSITAFGLPSEFGTGEKKDVTLQGHIDEGAIRCALALENDPGNPGNLYVLAVGKEFKIEPGKSFLLYHTKEHDPCTDLKVSGPGKVYFDAEGDYHIIAGAGYRTAEGKYVWTDTDAADVTVKKSYPLGIPTWGWILGGTAAVGIAGMIVTRMTRR